MQGREPLREAGAQISVFESFLMEADPNRGPGGFSELAAAFNAQITELQQLMCLRIEDHAKHLFIPDLHGLEASVHALEKVFRDIRQHLARERAAVPKARALLGAARTQQQRLAQMAANLPAHLPSSQAGGGKAAMGGSGVPAPLAAGGSTAAVGAPRPAPRAAAGGDDAAAGGRRRDAGGAAGAGAAAIAAPRWYVTQGELAAVASYMRGRLTLDKVNSALDEAALHAEQLARWMAAVRAHAPQRVPADERKRATEMFHALAGREGLRGQYWFTEAELRNGAALRPDKTGKALLTLLRHMGRVSEVRVSVEALGGATVVYVLQRGNE